MERQQLQDILMSQKQGLQTSVRDASNDEQYKDLQNKLETESLNPQELQDQIDRLEQEKLALVHKMNMKLEQKRNTQLLSVKKEK